MAASKLDSRKKQMAYILNKDYKYTMQAIGTLMKVSQSTISNAIKDVHYELKIYNLQNELNDVRKELKSLGFNEKPMIDIN